MTLDCYVMPRVVLGIIQSQLGCITLASSTSNRGEGFKVHEVEAQHGRAVASVGSGILVGKILGRCTSGCRSSEGITPTLSSAKKGTVVR